MNRLKWLVLMLMIGVLCACGTVATVPGEPIDELPDEEYHIITASIGTPDVHWWEEVEWKKNALLTNRSIEIAHVGETVFVDYIKFINVETSEATVWTAFETLAPEDEWFVIASLQEYKASSNLWAIRTDTMGHIGGQSLYALSAVSPQPLSFNPKLVGHYDIYVGTRATHIPMEVGFRLIDSSE